MVSLKNTVILTAAQDMMQLSEPLAKLTGIDYFGFVRVFEDNTHICLVTCPDWIEQFYTRYFHHGICHKSFQTFTSGYVYQGEAKDKTTVLKMKTDFNINPAFTIIDKQTDFVDLYSFASTDSSIDFAYYMRHMQIWHNFINYFKEKAKEIIIKAVCDRWSLPKLLVTAKQHPYDKKNNKLHLIYESFSHLDSCIISNLQRLTKKELKCLEYTAKGDTCQEVAEKLSVSKKTVEAHLRNAKIKLNAKNTKHLLVKVLEGLH